MKKNKLAKLAATQAYRNDDLVLIPLFMVGGCSSASSHL